MFDVIVVSGKCECDKCQQRTQDIYRMVGYCTNCGAKPVLMIFRAGDRAVRLDCPICRTHSVTPERLATEDEIPERVTHTRENENSHD